MCLKARKQSILDSRFELFHIKYTDNYFSPVNYAKMPRPKIKKLKNLKPDVVNVIANYFSVKQNAENVNPNDISMDASEDSDDEVIAKKSKKRNRVIDESDSDSDDVQRDDEAKLKKAKLTSSKQDEGQSSSSKLNLFDFDKSSTTSVDRLKKNIGSSSVSKPLKDISSTTRWTHEKLEFLLPDNIRDINRNRPNHPEYDYKTLYVPESYLNSLTPAMRQWWILKSKHFDTVLFFKVGKFYELYHMDATIGVNHLGFSYMRGEFAHSGFPETAYGRMAATLIELGFKVARVEQTETPEMMALRCKEKKVTKFDKVVNREICQISSKGTCVYGAQLTDAIKPFSSYILAIIRKKMDNQFSYGVCFVDVSIGTFHLGQFVDDRHNSKLLTLMAQHIPGLILLERNNLTQTCVDRIKQFTGNIKFENLKSGSEFYSANKTQRCLQEESYFKNKSEETVFPKILQDILSKGEMYEEALRALGACIWYLKRCLLDIQVLSMGQFQIYEPIDFENNLQNPFLILDWVAIQNLKLLGEAGTLQKSLDYCQTAFGKRLLQHWICKPSCDLNDIKERQNAVKELHDNPNVLRNARQVLKKLPDLERQIAKIHAFGNKLLSQKHPDGRAIMYEAVIYSKRKVLDLIRTLEALENGKCITAIFEGCQSKMLKKLTQCGGSNKFLDLSSSLQYFKDAFDQNEAKKEGQIVPHIGIDEDYDKVNEEIQAINKELDIYLNEQRRFFGCQVSYYGSDKKRFQLEVPDKMIYKVDGTYQIEGSKKGFKRYSTPTTKDLLAKMLKVESLRANVVKDLNRKIFEKFSEKRYEWERVTFCYMVLDVLCAFAEYANTFSEGICLPIFHEFSEKPMLKIENGFHPCIPNIETFVPNDTKLGIVGHEAEILLLTGPNMGGKSTLMRQVSLIIIMAQMGSFVPASFCELSLVDRIFTRLGGRDDILNGESTFLVELNEAEVILNHASKHSFVIIDELGRGTSTHDGHAIAAAYLNEMKNINCRTIFTTHYHSLVDYFSRDEKIQLGHMSCFVECEGDIEDEEVTFFYKLARGVCPKSYGFNVGRLAGLPQSILEDADEVSKSLELLNIRRQSVRSLFQNKGVDAVRKLITTLQNL